MEESHWEVTKKKTLYQVVDLLKASILIQTISLIASNIQL